MKFHPLMATISIMFIVLNMYAQDSLLLADPADDAQEPSAISGVVSLRRDGLFLNNENRSTDLRVHGFIQADGRFFSSDLKGESPDKLFFRRIRPIFEGTLVKELDFRFMPDFGQNNPQIQDAYLELNRFSFAKLRLGKFKSPVGLEDLRSDSEMSFSERSLASDLVPLREVGAQIVGTLLRDSAAYAVGYFNGTPDGSNGNFQWRTSNEGVARIFLQPFLTSRAKPLRGFGMGVGGSFADDRGKLPTFKTVGQNTFFKYSSHVLASGQHNRLSPQAYYYEGVIGLMGEYNVSSQEVRNGLNARRLSNRAWQASASIMLTGEKNSYTGVRPHHAFEPQRGLRHLGAWEIATRYSCLHVDRNAFPLFASTKSSAEAASEWGIALNWYLNRYVRIMNAYEHTSFTMASSQLVPLHDENVVMSRLQLGF